MTMNSTPSPLSKNIFVLSMDQFEEDYPQIANKSILMKEDLAHRYCRAVLYQGVFSTTMIIPKKESPIKEWIDFCIVWNGEKLFFIYAGEQSSLDALIQDFKTHMSISYDDPLQVLIWFLFYLIRSDMYYLEGYTQKLETIEEKMHEEKAHKMERIVLAARKDMNVMSNYYLQLSSIAETLQELALKREDNKSLPFISLYRSQIQQLSNIVDTVKDYANQIWDLHQSKLSGKQNKISTILTIITVVFLPLTLITGWFGMNFSALPLIHSTMGYYGICALSVIIVIVEVLYIIRKHLWK